ncbi:MAG TPA: division/cell wall cluster transcriptional repressor MraZ [Candidatus Paceibacterota bacterium]|nr:division/cell wall cluster transcriptional repressor MraZ [Candidatus Paceibacterota bacterium]HPQ23211.1 division/cell wall cluster transcriptional repressor MraZ [Candidatus Paceibacterota bacterium]
MFIGEYYYNLDTKGRMAIPSKIRNQVGETLIITRGLDSCLFLYEKKDWEQLAEKIKNLPLSQSNSRAFARLMLAGAMEVTIDNQGRILIPDYLRNYADLKKKIVLVGVYDRLEIWDEDNWNTYKNKTERESSEIAEKLSQLGI